MIHPTAIVSKNAEIGNNVEIGPFSIIHDNVSIGDNSKIGAFCEIGINTDLAKEKKLIIGNNSLIRSHSTIYIGSIIGDNLTTGHYVTIRENSILGRNIQLGNRTDVQGDCIIGDYTRTHADVHIGKLSKIGQFCWLFSGVILTNDPTPPSDELFGVTLEDYVVVSVNCILMPGIILRKNSVIAAGSLVNIDAPEGKLLQGNPAKVICNADVLRLKSNLKIRAYPWYKRFFRGYPKEIVLKWQNDDF
jgi:acetyltransferase-like isoleucine patch superfamily enzyme